MRPMRGPSEVVCGLDPYHRWNVGGCNGLGPLVGSGTLRIGGRGPHRLRFSPEGPILKSSGPHRPGF